jgi:hypothetical protein
MSEDEAMAIALPADFRCRPEEEEQSGKSSSSLSEEQHSFVEAVGGTGAPLETKPMPPGIRGALSKAAIRERITSRIDDVRWCYETAQTWKRDVAGRVTMRFVIAPSGGVAKAVVLANETGFDDLGCCIARKVATWTFPAPEGGGIVIVDYPFVLSPGATPESKEAPSSSTSKT